MKDIAVIVPVYKAHDTIIQTLHSIAMQKQVTFKTYLVVDGEEQGSYDYLRYQFSDIEIEIHYLPINVGPGVARQHGIDNSKEPYLSFIDADDSYLSSLALYYQKKPFIKSDKCVMVSCNFLQEKKDHDVKLMEKDIVWMHGKMYLRSFIDKYNIRFNDTRANEDVGFNTQCECFANEDEQINLAQDVTYLWQWRDNSTVRTDNFSYAFNESIEGFVQNKIYAFNQVLKQKELDDAIKFFILTGFVHMFRKYLLAMIKAPKRMKHVQKWAKKYYYNLYTKIDKEYLEKAEKTVLAKQGLNTTNAYDEYLKWKELLKGKKKK